MWRTSFCVRQGSGIVEHPGHLMAWLVAVPVAPFGEHGVKLGGKHVAAAHGFHESCRIVGHIPCVVARCSLSDEFCKVKCIVVGEESAVGMAPLGIAGRGVDYVAVVF